MMQRGGIFSLKKIADMAARNRSGSKSMKLIKPQKAVRTALTNTDCRCVVAVLLMRFPKTSLAVPAKKRDQYRNTTHGCLRIYSEYDYCSPPY